MIDNIELKLKHLIIKNLLMRVEPDDITDESDLVKDFVLDSLQMLRLVMDIENTFGISIQDQDSMIGLISKYKLLKQYVLEKVS